MIYRLQVSDIPDALNDIANLLYDIGDRSAGETVSRLTYDLRFMRRLRLVDGVLVYEPGQD